MINMTFAAILLSENGTILSPTRFDVQKKGEGEDEEEEEK